MQSGVADAAVAIELADVQRRVLKLRYELQGDQHAETFEAMVALATTLRVKGDLSEAEDLEKKALEGRRALLGLSTRIRWGPCANCPAH